VSIPLDHFGFCSLPPTCQLISTSIIMQLQRIFALALLAVSSTAAVDFKDINNTAPSAASSATSKETPGSPPTKPLAAPVPVPAPSPDWSTWTRKPAASSAAPKSAPAPAPGPDWSTWTSGLPPGYSLPGLPGVTGTPRPSAPSSDKPAAPNAAPAPAKPAPIAKKRSMDDETAEEESREDY
jgi:hypothetical protein